MFNFFVGFRSLTLADCARTTTTIAITIVLIYEDATTYSAHDTQCV